MKSKNLLVKGLDLLEIKVSQALNIGIWLAPLCLFMSVICRYVFNIGATWLVEMAIYCQIFVVLMGLSTTLKHNRHVRLDIFYSRCSKRTQDIIQALGHLFFLIPFCVFMVIGSWDYVERAWTFREASSEADGLAWLYLIKTFLIIGPALLGLQAIHQLIQIFNKYLTQLKTT